MDIISQHALQAAQTHATRLYNSARAVAPSTADDTPGPASSAAQRWQQPHTAPTPTVLPIKRLVPLSTP